MSDEKKVKLSPRKLEIVARALREFEGNGPLYLFEEVKKLREWFEIASEGELKGIK